MRENLLKMDADPLVNLPMEKWTDLQKLFKADWPRGISGFTILETQKEWIREGHDYGFKVFCPFGDVTNGMVALNNRNESCEIVIQCPSDDTSKLEEALRRTKRIDWERKIVLPFTPGHVIECIKRVLDDVNSEIEFIGPAHSFIFNKDNSLFDISLPPNLSFGFLTPAHVDLVDAVWPHRYPGSSKYYQVLIEAKCGYGLFKNQELISWVFINEAGTLRHMFTLERHRRKKYAEILLKMICNKLIKEGKDTFAFCVRGNENACKLYMKLGFETYECGVAWCTLNKSVK